jgi:hypothetical protein
MVEQPLAKRKVDAGNILLAKTSRIGKFGNRRSQVRILSGPPLEIKREKPVTSVLETVMS